MAKSIPPRGGSGISNRGRLDDDLVDRLKKTRDWYSKNLLGGVELHPPDTQLTIVQIIEKLTALIADGPRVAGD